MRNEHIQEIELCMYVITGEIRRGKVIITSIMKIYRDENYGKICHLSCPTYLIIFQRDHGLKWYYPCPGNFDRYAPL